MRIVIDLQSCQNGSRHRGIGRYAFEISKALFQYAGQHDYWVLLNSRFPESIAALKRDLRSYLSPERFVLFSPLARATAAAPENAWRNRASEIVRGYALDRLCPDVVFIPSLFEGFWDDAVVSLERANYVSAVALHDLIPYTYPDQHLLTRNDRLAYLRKVHSLRDADTVLAVSDYVADQAITLLGLERDRVVSTLEGHADVFRPLHLTEGERRAALQRFGISKRFVLNVSPFEFRKNIDGMIAGFAALPASLSDELQLAIVGNMDGYARQYVRARASTEGLRSDAIIFCGGVSDSDLALLYNLCELFVLPSISEGFGLPALEAMACGTAVIGSDRSSIPEIVRRPDALFDPLEPADIARTMARFLSDRPKLEALKVYGYERSKEYSWKNSALRIERALESAVAAKQRPCGDKASAPSTKPAMAFVSPLASSRSLAAAYLRALLPSLASYYDITIISLDGACSDDWLCANFEIRDAQFLASHFADFDRVILNLDSFTETTTHPVLQRREVVVVSHPSLELVDRGEVPRTAHVLANIWSVGGYGALIEAVRDGFKATGSRYSPHRWCGTAIGHIVGRSEAGGDLIPPVFQASTEWIDPLPIVREFEGASDVRRWLAVEPHVPTILAIAGSCDLVAAIAKAFRRSNSKEAVLLIWTKSSRTFTSRTISVERLPGRIVVLRGSIEENYIGLLSIASSVMAVGVAAGALLSRLRIDVAARGCHFAEVGSGPASAVEEDLEFHLERSLAKARSRAQPIGPDPMPLQAKKVAKEFFRAVEQLYRDPAITSYRTALGRLKKEIRGVVPSEEDILGVAQSVAATEEYLRRPQLFIDVTIFAAPGAKRLPTGRLRAFLLAALADAGRRVEPVYFDGQRFLRARGFVASLLSLAAPFAPDEEVVARIGDTIVTFLDLDSEAAQALGRLCAAGARHIKVEMLDAILASSTRLRASVGHLVDKLEMARNAAGSLEVGADSDDASTHASRGMSGAHFVVKGHVKGTYSLALINRSVACALEARFPEKVRFEPYETELVTELTDIPSEDLLLFRRLVSTPPRDRKCEIAICQHYPVLPYGNECRLALALFAWEESRVPAEIVKRLSSEFHGVIAPSEFVAKALIDSGLQVPVAALGQPSSVEHLKFAGRPKVRRPGSPRTFLHVSSCFPRKGVDVLLRAWARAFDVSSQTRLVIKTFPNPHNDVRQQVEKLLAANSRCAPIEVIDRELGADEMRELFRNADVMVLPTRGEGYNLPALEAMLCRLPVIVTDYGGHQDFCSSDEARLIRYRFASSGSHVGSAFSLWVEPDEDDLVDALREYAQVDMVGIGPKLQRARAAAIAAANHDLWVLRLHEFVEELSGDASLPHPTVAWVSTWNVQCGIAQYSRDLLDALDKSQKARITVYCDLRTSSPSRADEDIPCTPCWELGWNAPMDGLLRAVEEARSDVVVIQHQDGLISWANLTVIIETWAEQRRTIIVCLHNVPNMRKLASEELRPLVEALKKADRILVHTLDDVNALTELGLANRTTLFPHGAKANATLPPVRDLDMREQGPVIGCHGFLFPHKGIDKLIMACAALLREWPNLRLRLVTAVFPESGSRRYLAECKSLAEELGASGAIEWHTEFLSKEAIDRLLSQCDLVVLPYDETSDSASGAARAALSSLSPLLLTGVRIFAEFKGVTGQVASNDPALLRDAIDRMLKDKALRQAIQQRMLEWLKHHDWRSIGSGLGAMIRSLSWQTRWRTKQRAVEELS